MNLQVSYDIRVAKQELEAQIKKGSSGRAARYEDGSV
jgi:hypothetical protein